MPSAQQAEREERKRTLGVLAQRRYRQRKKERLRRLESLAVDASPGEESIGSSTQCACDTSNGGHVLANSTDSEAQLQAHHATFPASEYSWDGLGINDDDWAFLDVQMSPANAVSLLPPTNSAALRLAEDAVSHAQFSDDRILDVPELDLMNTAYALAKLLKCEDTIWSFTASRVLDLSPLDVDALPMNLQPTLAQRSITHHPVFDLLPWPSVRTKLICAFAQPPAMRPLIARDEMALMRFVNDIDEAAEGLKVSGADRCDGKNWEVGQQVLENWWWAFDLAIVANSNALRARRGAPRLRLGQF